MLKDYFMKHYPWLTAVFVVFAVIGVCAGIILSSHDSGTVPEAAEQTEVSEIDYSADYDADRKSPVDLAMLRKTGQPVLICIGNNSYEGRVDMYNAVKRINREYEKKAFVYYINTDEYPEAAEGLFVPAVPVVICIDSKGEPYIPDDKIDDKYGFQLYCNPLSKEPVYTYHLGCLNRWELRELLAAMGAEK